MKHLFSTRVRVVLIIAVLLAVILAVIGSLTGLSVPDMMVKGILTPIRSGVSKLTQHAEQLYNYMFEYESLAAENEELKEKLLGCDEIFKNGYDYFSSLRPADNKNAYDAFLFDIKRSYIAVQKIFMLSDKPFKSREEAMAQVGKIDRMIATLTDLKWEHKERWFADNRQSEWNYVEARYDELIGSFHSLKRYCLNARGLRSVKKL